MEEYNNLIDELDKILNELSSIEDITQKRDFFTHNLSIFLKFKDSLNVILRLYQFKESGNDVQNKYSNKLENIIAGLLQHHFLFVDLNPFEYFMSNLLDTLSFNEGKFAFNLQYETNIPKIEIAVEYMKTRTHYLEILEANSYFKRQDLNENSAITYSSTTYEKSMIGHALMQIKNTFLNMTREEIVRLLQCLDFSNFFSEPFAKSGETIGFYDRNLINQYTDTILKLKSIFIPDKLENDPFIQAMWNGKIKDPKTLQSILKNISMNGLDILSRYSSENTPIPFIIFLANHFKEVNCSDQDIAIIINEILNKGLSLSQVAAFLADINIPQDNFELLDSEYSQIYPWLLEGNVFQTLMSKEKIIESGKDPYLPAEYYIKKLNSANVSSLDEHFVQNLITLLHSDYYTEDEKKALVDGLKENNLYSPYISTETITFSDADLPETIHENILRSYYSGQIIPLNVATSLINQFISTSTNIPHSKKILEACVQSIISNSLAKKRN